MLNIYTCNIYTYTYVYYMYICVNIYKPILSLQRHLCYILDLILK